MLQVRWAESVGELDIKLQGVVGDTLISAAAVSYIGSFTAKYRKILINMWVDACRDEDIPISETFDFIKTVVDAHQVSYNNHHIL